MSAGDTPVHLHQLVLKLCSEDVGKLAVALQPHLAAKRPWQMVAELADLMAGIAQGTAMTEETFRMIIEEVVRGRFDRGWTFGGAPPGVEPS